MATLSKRAIVEPGHVFLTPPPLPSPQKEKILHMAWGLL